MNAGGIGALALDTLDTFAHVGSMPLPVKAHSAACAAAAAAFAWVGESVGLSTDIRATSSSP